MELCVYSVLAHRVAAHFDAVGIVNQPVEDTVSQRRIADLLVPGETGSCEVRMVERAWQRSSQISQKSRRSGSDSGAMAPVVDYQNIDAAEARQQTAQAARRVKKLGAIKHAGYYGRFR